MGSVGNQNSWTPYYSYKDCSQGLCSIYCPQFCYFIFPPPPPPDDDAATPFSPLIIAVIGVLASAFILVSYYTIVTRYCKRGGQNTGLEDENEAGHDQWQAASSAGLDEAVIKTIAVCAYRKGEGLIEGTECAVCLSEFRENEPLRLLPKCSHAFHLPCIDTWLKSHSNCPLCRANVAPLAQPSPNSQSSGADSYEVLRPDDLILVVEDHGLECCEEVAVSVDEGDSTTKSRGVVGEFRRSVSLGAFPSHCRFMDEELRVEKDQPGGMKRSSSTGRFMFFDHVKGKNFIVPH